MSWKRAVKLSSHLASLARALRIEVLPDFLDDLFR